MRTIEQFEKNINNLDTNFNRLISNDGLDIYSIEELAMNSIDDCKSIINTRIEELISKSINEHELITKKTRVGRKRIQIKKSWKK